VAYSDFDRKRPHIFCLTRHDVSFPILCVYGLIPFVSPTTVYNSLSQPTYLVLDPDRH
jgi:hypothetical protein